MEPLKLTDRETEVLAAAWQCIETEPKVNTVKLAELTGYTEKSAGVMFGKIRRKLKEHAAGLEANPPSALSGQGGPKAGKGTPKSTKSSPKKRAAAGVDESPTKKTKAGKKASIVKAANANEFDGLKFEHDHSEFDKFAGKVKLEQPMSDEEQYDI